MSPEGDLKNKLWKLIAARILFSSLLLGSTLFLQFNRAGSLEAAPLAVLYGLTACIFMLSAGYALALLRLRRYRVFAYLQTIVDTALVTVILLVTGGFSSPFSFLYLVVIVTSSLLLPRRGTVLVAALCSVQFGLLADFEYYGLLAWFDGPETLSAYAAGWDQVATQIVTILAACIVVAFLSSFLADQAVRTRRELRVMEAHVKRVEKMAGVGEMAAGLAHEIKNPLAGLAGAIQLLREEIRYDPDHDRLMQIILREADRLSALVGNFLLYAKPPVGQSEPIDLHRALRETVELFGKKGTLNGRVSTTLKAEPGIWVGMDPGHLRQVLWNLLINAADAIEGPGRIRVELSAGKDRSACLKIADSGGGMPPETLASIFDPFFTTKANGTGLGLSIVHRILEAYDCRLDVESAPGQGTTFSLHFRQIEEPARPAN
ncbi:MAG: ATP-binding protein [Desulfobacterales bacterium]|jgi:two-component system sensor histidine kinase PilS (NtrC family)|nr:ATP-binding protein [Desulfobacterales bacterium]MCU0601715.1 ATP-binding protein [Desulfobacterales bacterium]